MSPEITRPPLQKSDQFIGFFQKRLYQLESRKKQIFWILIAIVVAGLIIFGIQTFQMTRNKSLANDFSKVMDKLPTNYSQDTGNWTTFLTEVDAFIKNHPRSTFVPVLNLYKGKAQFSLKQYDQALGSYQTAKKDLQPPYQYLAAEGEGITQMQLEHWNESLAIWLSLADKKDDPVQDFHLYNLALVQVQLGQHDIAEKTFERLEKDYPNSSYTTFAKNRFKNTTTTVR